MNADVRGSNNALLSGMIGKESNVVYVEAPVFFGITRAGAFNTFNDTEVNFSGLRRYAVGANDVQVWEGQPDFKRIELLANQEKLAVNNALVSIVTLEAVLARAVTFENNLPATATQAEIDQAAQAVIDAQDALDAALIASTAVRLNKVYSRGLLLGAGAAQHAMGVMPDYRFEWTKFKKKSESMLEIVTNVKKTNLALEMGADYAGRTTDIDYGVIAIDMEN
jgi:hypothetical protein